MLWTCTRPPVVAGPAHSLADRTRGRSWDRFFAGRPRLTVPRPSCRYEERLAVAKEQIRVLQDERATRAREEGFGSAVAAPVPPASAAATWPETVGARADEGCARCIDRHNDGDRLKTLQERVTRAEVWIGS